MAISNKQKQTMDRLISELETLLDEVDDLPRSGVVEARVVIALGFAVDAVMVAREESSHRE